MQNQCIKYPPSGAKNSPQQTPKLAQESLTITIQKNRNNWSQATRKTGRVFTHLEAFLHPRKATKPAPIKPPK
jgi:hypothetical protein